MAAEKIGEEDDDLPWHYGIETEFPPEFEPIADRALLNGGMEVIFRIAQPHEWIEKYPDAFLEAQDEVLGEVGRAFEIMGSDLRRISAAEALATADEAVALDTSHPKSSRSRTAGGDHLTLTVEEAAEQLGISRALAYEAVRRREIPSVKIGRRILIPKAALHRMLESAGIEDVDLL